ncbi:prostate androgen-regulated mucin-like protein 1 isoform X3 [Talpa occidentalis]|uniref:prostate androgen-regulated mucin-like protein 1 isoform X3 n=1 Tax=Talpa occidentalis TaxID=50954 RepID=UPI0023F99E91|nr:prostate androgen-regulated mucin-like protein 1 isoform X3 [Talpa occidentalis]
MVYQTLFALCIFTAGLRVQSLPTASLLPVSLSAKTVPTTAIWTSSLQSLPASPTSGTPSNSVLPVTASSVQTSPLPKNVSTEPTEEEATTAVSKQAVTDTHSSPTTSGIQLTHTPVEHSPSTPEPSVPTTRPPSSVTSPTLTISQAPASSPSPLSTTPPEASSVSISTNHSSAENSTQPTGAPTPPKSTAEEHSSDHITYTPASAEPVPAETTHPATVSTVVTCRLKEVEITTASPGVIMQEVEHALSSGSIAAITVAVIAVVLLVFGVAAYLKIRHSSYGRLLDDHDYGSWGNYNNPLYDDS